MLELHLVDVDLFFAGSCWQHRIALTLAAVTVII